MQVDLENLSGVARKLKITIPSEQVEDAVQKKLQQLLPSVKIAGFRTGKVPLTLVAKRYGASVRTEVTENFIRDSYITALKEKELNPVQPPKIELITAAPQQPLHYHATFEVYPEITIADLSTLTVEKINATITDDDLNEMLERLRKEKTEWRPVTAPERKAQKGDQLIIDFTIQEITTTTEPYTEEEKNIKFILGDSTMWPEFEQNLYGVVPGENKKFTLQFPDTHVKKELIGKTAEFTVTVQEVNEPLIPALDEELAKKFNVTEGGVPALKSQVKTNMEEELHRVTHKLYRQAIMDQLLASTPVTVPQSLVAKELERLGHQWKRRFGAPQNPAQTTPEFPRHEFVKQAEESVALGLLLAKIAKDNQITVNTTELRSYIEKMAAQYTNEPSKIVEWYFADTNRLSEIKATLLEEKVLTYLATQFQIVEKELSYQEVMAKR